MNTYHYKETVVVLFAAGVVLTVLFHQWIFIVLGLVILLSGLFSGRVARAIHQAWMFLSSVLSYMVTHVLLTILFFLILTPLSLTRKIFTAFRKNRSNGQESYFNDITEIYEGDFFKRPW